MMPFMLGFSPTETTRFEGGMLGGRGYANFAPPHLTGIVEGGWHSTGGAIGSHTSNLMVFWGLYVWCLFKFIIIIILIIQC